MKFKQTTTLMLSMIAIILCVTFTSCDNDDNNVVDNSRTYQIGFSQVNMSTIGSASSNEEKIIFKAYYDELGITKSNFEISGGDNATNDATVKAKCEAAQKKLESKVFKGYFVISVKRGLNLIHEATFGTKK